jgi:hypothetical protein
MAVLKTFGLQQDDVKVRWEEPYVSVALNKALMALPRGVYSGFTISEQTVQAKGVTIRIGTTLPYHLALVTDVASGYKAVVQRATDFDLDIPYTTTGSPQTFYVWIDVDYAVSSATAGYVRAGDGADRTVNSLTIAKIVVPASQAIITDADITQDATDPDTLVWPIPDESEYNMFGLLDEAGYLRLPSQDQKDAMDGAASPSSANPFATQDGTLDKALAEVTELSVTSLVAVTEFQLMGTFYVGTGAAGTAERWFALFGVDSNTGLLGTASRSIAVNEIWDSTNVAQLDPSTDAPSGYYTNPYVKMSFGAAQTDYTGDLIVRCLAETAYSGLTELALDPNSFGVQPDVPGWLAEDVIANTSRRPTTVTVGPFISSALDFSQYGTRSLMEAVKTLGSTTSLGGIIFVKQGTYIWDEAVVANSNIQIICEPHGITGYGVLIELQHAAGFALTSNRGLSIKDAKMYVTGTSSSALSLNGTSGGINDLDNVDINDGVISLDGRCKAYRLQVSAPSGEVALLANNGLSGPFVECEFYGGPAMELANGAQIDVTFERTTFGFSAGSVNEQLIKSGASGFDGTLRFTNCVYGLPATAYTQTAVPKADFLMADDARLFIDGLFMGYTNAGEDASAPFLRVEAVGEHTYASLKGIIIQAAHNTLYQDVDLPADSGIIMLSAGATALTGNTINAEEIVMRGFRGQTTLERARLIAIQAIDPTAEIRLSGCKIYDCASLPTADSSIYAIRTYGGGLGAGKIFIEDQDIILDVDYPSSGILNMFGIYIDQSDLDAGSLVSIRGGRIQDCYSADVRVESGYDGDFIMIGMSGYLSAKYNTKTPIHRWNIGGSNGRRVISNNMFTDVSNCTAHYILAVYTSLDCSVHGNCLYHNQALGESIYMGDSVAQCAILGNSGRGRISVLNATNFMGVGDSGYDATTFSLNSLTTSYR